MAYTVKAVADLAGVSIRTLHHYDEIGLLKPAEVTPAGYRLYTEGDLERLQQVLFFRELGFSLQEIKEITSRPDFDRRQALLNHRQLLLDRRERLKRRGSGGARPGSMRSRSGGPASTRRRTGGPSSRKAGRSTRPWPR